MTDTPMSALSRDSGEPLAVRQLIGLFVPLQLVVWMCAISRLTYFPELSFSM